jgi:type IV pilus assembly protein PilY1
MKPLSYSALVKSAARVVAAATLVVGPNVAGAADLQLSNKPLFLDDGVPPNIVFTMDDSGSMDWGYMPDNIGNSFHAYKRGLAFEVNWVAYNPFEEYTVPVTDSSALGSKTITTTPIATTLAGTLTSFTSAYDDGYAKALTGYSCTVNLESNYRPTWDWPTSRNPGPHCSTVSSGATGYAGRKTFHDLRDLDGTANKAFYYIHYTHHPQGLYPRGNPPLGCPGPTTFNDDACYVKIRVEDTPLTRPNPALGGAVSARDVAQEKQNFANWYSYYRTRNYAARAGVGRAFSTLNDSVRVGFGRINGPSELTLPRGTLRMGVRVFNTTARTDYAPGPSPSSATTPRKRFFDLLYETSAQGGTPLRRAADDVGKYFDLGNAAPDTLSPWDATPGDNDTANEMQCRQSYHILMSDGYWNDATASGDARLNNDGTDGSVIIEKQYTTTAGRKWFKYVAGEPFSDIWPRDAFLPTWHSNYKDDMTLADVAMYYWKRDLRTCSALGCSNEVPTNADDPAFWQHLVTFTVGFGVEGGSVDKDEAFEDAAARDAVLAYAGDPRGACDPISETCKGSTAPAGPKWGITWPQPSSTATSANLDDMLHAAVNGHGDFLNAQQPKQFADGLAALLANIAKRAGSAASVVLNTGTATSSSRVYQARFQTLTGSWTGQLLAYAVDPATGLLIDALTGVVGGSDPKALWDAGTLVPAYDSRQIATLQPRTGPTLPPVAVAWRETSIVAGTPLGDSLKSQLPTANRTDPWLAELVRFIRGDNRCEIASNNTACLPGGNDGIFRDRTSRLGDIINSAPAYVGAPKSPYYFTSWGKDGTVDAPENASPYSTWAATKANRRPMIYVGANDGMLHAFDASVPATPIVNGKPQKGATEGVEKFAYIPGAVVKSLGALSSTLYTHSYYVDGSPTVGDAFVGGDWRTMLVGGLNGGGQAVYALDVTNPDSNDESTASSWVKWEFTDVDLGYTFSRPNIVRLNNGKWAAVFGNGYNSTELDGSASTTGNAVLYVVDLSDGTLIRKIDTGVGLSNPFSGGKPNGLATVAPVDRDGDFKVDFVYGGDLYGNLWKFDLQGATTTGWGVARGGAPLSRARTKTDVVQPITSRPQVRRHPTDPSSFLVLFGTGKYLETGDHNPTDPNVQTFYAVWDRPTDNTVVTRDKLLPQAIVQETNVLGFDYRVTTGYGMSWYLGSGVPATNSDASGFDPATVTCTNGCYLGWRMDLVNVGVGSPSSAGERQVSDSVLRGDKIIFTTLIPTVSPCNYGGDGWLMELEATSGSRLSYSPFNVDQDAQGVFNYSDYVLYPGTTSTNVPVSGRKSKVGIIPTPAILARDGGEREFKYESGSTGKIEVIYENPGPLDVGRQSWRELRR